MRGCEVTKKIKEEKMRNFFVCVLLVLFCMSSSGCAVGILAAGVGYAVGQGRKGTAKVMEAKSQYVEKYQNYRVELEKINLDREKAGLKPINIPTFEEWLETQPLSASEVKLFQKYGIISSKELKAKEQAKVTEETETPKETSEPKTNFSP